MNKYSKDTDELISLVQEDMLRIYQEYLGETTGVSDSDLEVILTHALNLAWSDLISLAEKDPSAHSRAFVRETYPCFEAVMYYRVAHSIHYCNMMNPDIRKAIARKISERAKLETHIDINPAAKIGRGFVVDHGVSVVIGETAEIGHECYIVQGVILGALTTGGGPAGKRHPTLGNRVKVGAFARILGPVTIGDDVSISPMCVVTQNVPSGYKVVIVNQLQLSKLPGETSSVFFGAVPRDHQLIVYGQNLANCRVSLTTDCAETVEHIQCTVESNDNNHFALRFKKKAEQSRYDIKKLLDDKRLILAVEIDGNTTYLTQCKGLEESLKIALV